MPLSFVPLSTQHSAPNTTTSFVQLAGILFLGVLAQIIEKKAAMRGCHRNPLPAWFDRFLRIAFLSILVSAQGRDAIVRENETREQRKEKRKEKAAHFGFRGRKVTSLLGGMAALAVLSP